MTVTEPFLTAMGGPRPAVDPVRIEIADSSAVAAHRGLRHTRFVAEQRLFATDDGDAVDGEPTTLVLVAIRSDDGAVVGGVRAHPYGDRGAELGWWRGSRLVVAPGSPMGTGARLVRAAMALVDERGAVRFDATVQLDKRRFFERLGWTALDHVDVAGVAHVLMVAPQARFTQRVAEHKQPLGRLLAGMAPGGHGFVGDDGAPVPGTDLVAACDAIVPAMVERDPAWAGWCAVVVNLNDLAAMGATPVGLLDAVAGRTEAHVAAVLDGVRRAAAAYGVPVLGGHTQLGTHGSLAVTALGHAADPVPGGGGVPGDDVHLLVDLGGQWRPGYRGMQWDSTSHRSPAELQRLVSALARHRPAAAKDVSMAGVVGTLGMLAEASGTGAELDVAAVPRPADAPMLDWLTCFPGFALVTADRPGRARPEAPPAVSARVGRLTADTGVVTLRWPDGRRTVVLSDPVTGLGAGVSTPTAIAAVAAPFGRDLDQCLATIAAALDQARRRGADLVVLPEAALGGYLMDLSGGAPGTVPDLPPALDLDGPVVRRVAELAGELVVCVGLCEADGARRFNTAACVHDGAVLGAHRKVHLPLREDASYDAGDRFAAFDTPVGRLGLLVCYDKAFPESGRCLALDGADVIACLSAWPASRTAATPDLADDRWTHRFDLYDRAGALANQVVWASANQSGTFGDLRFVASAKVVGPGGDVLAETGVGAGMAVASVDIPTALATARRSMSHLRDRRPHTYAQMERVPG